MFVCFLRLNRLLQEIMAEKENKTLIFVETKKKADDLTRKMKREGSVHFAILRCGFSRSILIQFERFLSGFGGILKFIILFCTFIYDSECFQVASRLHSWRQISAGARLGSPR